MPRYRKLPAKETCIATCWIGFSKNNEIGSDRGLDSFCWQVLEGFKIFVCSTYQGYNNGEVGYDERAAFREESDTRNKKFTQEHAWRILRTRPEWDSPEPVNLDDPTEHPKLFGGDAKERPPGKPRKAKTTKSDTTSSSARSTLKILSEVLQSEFRRKREAAEKATR
uniref:No apical meristem-associated C-terminal domain-containing protein n=1 Tax=Tanacetum cinerariifolium TaxID=118510 RepID=A0A6L2LMX9_TANCI|nr:hypothetical protein [Tanacetum cinerariifolium]